jgi:hypothetical protein
LTRKNLPEEIALLKLATVTAVMKLGEKMSGLSFLFLMGREDSEEVAWEGMEGSSSRSEGGVEFEEMSCWSVGTSRGGEADGRICW